MYISILNTHNIYIYINIDGFDHGIECERYDIYATETVTFLNLKREARRAF